MARKFERSLKSNVERGIDDSIEEAESAMVTEEEMSNIENIVTASEAEIDEIDQKQLRSQGHSKQTGFEKSYAKSEFKANPFKAHNMDPYDSPFELMGKNPARVYKQISFNNFRKNGFRDNRGWIPLTANNKTSEDFPTPETEYGVAVQNDGFFHVGDRIWAWMPRESYAKIRKLITERANRRVGSLTSKYRETAKQDKIKIEVEDECSKY